MTALVNRGRVVEISAHEKRLAFDSGRLQNIIVGFKSPEFPARFGVQREQLGAPLNIGRQFRTDEGGRRVDDPVVHQRRHLHIDPQIFLPDDFAVGNIQRGDGFVFQADEDARPIAGVGALPYTLGRREGPFGRARFEVQGEKRRARGGEDDRIADDQRRMVDGALGLDRPRQGEVFI